jgi:hypothetical protein
LLQEPSSFAITFVCRHGQPSLSASERNEMEDRLHVALEEREEIAPAHAMLALLQAAGRKATETARAELKARGIVPVIWHEGCVVEIGD